MDQGSAYISKEMRPNFQVAGVTLHEALIENPETIGVVEFYHAPLRAAYEKIRTELNKDVSDVECSKMAVYAINCTTGPEGLRPMLLGFGAILRASRSTPAPSQVQRSMVMDAAIRESEREQAKRRLAFGLRHQGNGRANRHAEQLNRLPVGSKVLVYRQSTRSWTGPFRFIKIEGNTAIVQLPRGRRIFRSSCVKPWR